MYQLEVKKSLIAHCFPATEDWEITVDIDAMERGETGQHPADKKGDRG